MEGEGGKEGGGRRERRLEAARAQEPRHVAAGADLSSS